MEPSRPRNSVSSARAEGNTTMKRLWSLSSALGAVLILCTLLLRNVSAAPLVSGVTKFSLCSTNVKSIILTKVPGNATKWEFVITLNKVGARQFRELEDRSPGALVDVVWDGIYFGRRRLDLPVQPDAENLFLGSRWFNHQAAEWRFTLLNKRLLRTKRLDSPCGSISH